MDDKARLVEYLRRAGATDAQLEEAERTGTLGPLGLELALRPRADPIPFDEAASRAGLATDDAAALWRAVGFPDPRHAPTSLGRKEAESLRVMAELTRSPLGQETTLRIARVLGSSVAQLAEAIVDSFRIKVEMPRHDRGEPYSEIVEDYSRVASIMVPALVDVIGDVLAGHLIAVSRAQWGLDEQRATVTRDLTVGFADLVDYTRSARALAPAELAAAVDRFEACVAEVIARHGGRVVKLIGDEAMFVAEDPAAAVRMAVELLEQFRPDGERGQVRIGLAAGPVVSHQGDYFGDTVNLAARLVKVAEPETALISESIAERGPSPPAAEPIDIGRLKGYDGPARAFRLT